MKKFNLWYTISFLSTILLVIFIFKHVTIHFEYQEKFESYWWLADKSSTIPKKLEYIDKFVGLLENDNIYGEYDAFFFKTPNNSFDQNLIALKTLQQRLHEIENMNVTSFQYQTAIHQITEQEQGEALRMLSVIRGSWYIKHHIHYWNWITGVIGFVLIISMFSGFIMLDITQY